MNKALKINVEKIFKKLREKCHYEFIKNLSRRDA